MNFRLTAVLFGLLLLLVVVLLAVTLVDDGTSPGDALLPQLVGVKADAVDAVEVVRTGPDGGKLVFARVGTNGWKITEPVAARADRAAVDALVAAVLGAKAVPAPEAGGPNLHGLEPPSLAVTLKVGSDKAATLNVGDLTAGADRSLAYVTSSARPGRVVAVRRTDLDPLLKDAARKEVGPAGPFAKWAADYRSRQLVAADARSGADDAEAVTLTSGGKTLALSRGPNGWQITTPPLGDADSGGDATSGTFTGVRPLLTALTALQAFGPDDFVDAPKDLKEYGLDPSGPGFVRAALKGKAGPEEVVLLGKPVDGAPGKVWAKVEGETGVVKATAANVDALRAAVADPGALRDRNLLAVGRERIGAVDVAVGGQTLKLRQVPGADRGATWTLFGGPGDPQPAGTGAVDALLNPLTEKRTIRDFSPADPKNDGWFAPAEVKAEVKVWADTLDPKADPKKEPDLAGKKPTTLVFGKVEGNDVHVRRTRPDGSTADLVLPVELAVGPAKTAVKTLDAVAKTRLDFLDPSLKGFATTTATRLTVVAANGETTELAKSEVLDPQYPTGRWEFVKPDAKKGQAANAAKVEEMLQFLATATAGKFVEEEPKADTLGPKYGLDPKAPRVKVTVTLGPDAGPHKERVYQFGNDSADKGAIFARVAGKGGVFTVSKFTTGPFVQLPDLRDPTLVTFDRTRLKGIKLRGWGTVVPGGYTLELEKNPGGWTAKTPAGYALDGAKADGLANAIFTARAKAFAAGPPTKAEFGFGVETQKGLEVTLLMDGGLPPLQVNLGGEADGGASVYAVCSQRPGDVVTVDAGPFKALMEKPTALQK